MHNHVKIETLQVGLLGTNCYILCLDGREDCAVIDPGGEAERIRQACGDRHVAAILLTHGHFDHIAAVAELMQPGAELVIHAGDADMLQDPRKNVSWMVGQRITAPAPTHTAVDGEELTLAGMTFRVYHTPGHTPGGVCYEVGNMLFTGDTMFQEGYGRTDLPGGDWQQLLASLRRIAPMRDDHTIYCGHGG